jgi:hypothetical protein
MAEGLDERVLHRFFGVLHVSQNSHGHTKDASLMLSHKRLESPSLKIPVLGGDRV